MATSPCLAGALPYGKCAGKSVFLWYAFLRCLCEKQPTTFQCDSDAIWTFNDGKSQKHSVSSANDGSTFPVGAWHCAIRMRPLPDRLDLLLAANFSQFRQRLPKKNTMPSGLRGRTSLSHGRLFRTRDETARVMPLVARFHLSCNSNFVGHLFRVSEAINMFRR